MANSQGRGMALNMMVMMGLLLLWVHHSSAAVYNVGDRSSWALPSIDYNQWARTKPIRVNDVLKCGVWQDNIVGPLGFSYSSEIHNVLMVSKADYDQCGSRRPLASYANGNTMVRLTKRGTYYFICGVPGHCSAGMKMAVTVY